MKTINFLDLKTANAQWEDELVAAASKAIRSGRYINGVSVKMFEHELAQYCQTTYAIAVSNGLDALRLILRAYIELGYITPGDEVIVPSNTYIATVLAVSDNNLTPVFVEPDLATMNLDISLIEQHITSHTRAIMPVHLYGTPCWSLEMNELAKRHDLKIIEDNAQAIGATCATVGLNGTNITGGLGHAAGISFYPTKNLGALGDAVCMAQPGDLHQRVLPGGHHDLVDPPCPLEGRQGPHQHRRAALAPSLLQIVIAPGRDIQLGGHHLLGIPLFPAQTSQHRRDRLPQCVPTGICHIHSLLVQNSTKILSAHGE